MAFTNLNEEISMAKDSKKVNYVFTWFKRVF